MNIFKEEANNNFKMYSIITGCVILGYIYSKIILHLEISNNQAIQLLLSEFLFLTIIGKNIKDITNYYIVISFCSFSSIGFTFFLGLDTKNHEMMEIAMNSIFIYICYVLMSLFIYQFFVEKYTLITCTILLLLTIPSISFI